MNKVNFDDWIRIVVNKLRASGEDPDITGDNLRNWLYIVWDEGVSATTTARLMLQEGRPLKPLKASDFISVRPIGVVTKSDTLAHRDAAAEPKIIELREEQGKLQSQLDNESNPEIRTTLRLGIERIQNQIDLELRDYEKRNPSKFAPIFGAKKCPWD